MSMLITKLIDVMDDASHPLHDQLAIFFSVPLFGLRFFFYLFLYFALKIYQNLVFFRMRM